MTRISIWPDDPPSGSHQEPSDVQAVTVGTRFWVTQSGLQVTHIRVWIFHGDNHDRVASILGLFDTTTLAVVGQVSRDPDTPNPVDEGWDEVELDTPIPLTANQDYYAAAYYPFGQYEVCSALFETDPQGDDTIVAPKNGIGHSTNPGDIPHNGGFFYAADVLSYPSDSFGENGYLVDVVVQSVETPTASNIKLRRDGAWVDGVRSVRQDGAWVTAA